MMRRLNSQEMDEESSSLKKAYRSVGEKGDNEETKTLKLQGGPPSTVPLSSIVSWFTLPRRPTLSQSSSRINELATTSVEMKPLQQPQLEESGICPTVTMDEITGISPTVTMDESNMLSFELPVSPMSGDSSLSSSSSSSSLINLFDTIDLASDLESAHQQKHQIQRSRPKRPAAALRLLRQSLQAKTKPLDVEKYAAGREMTKTQERCNAISMVPPTIYCIVYLLTGAWINPDLLEKAKEDYASDPLNFQPQWPSYNHNNHGSPWNQMFLSPAAVGCLPWNFLPALPPWTILAVIVGTTVHMPFSFLYHWKYAHSLDRVSRLNHWSRRMDHSMIHFASAMFSYASSGSVDFFLACALFNLHGMYRHFCSSSPCRPRSNQLRILIAILTYSLPLLRRGDLDKFGLFWLVVATSMWLFSKYPIGGWSHSAFHLLIGFVPVIIMQVAQELPVAQPQLQFAAQCSVLNSHLHSAP